MSIAAPHTHPLRADPGMTVAAVLAAAMAVLLLAAGPAGATDVVAVGYLDYPPYYYKAPDGAPKGILMDTADAVFRKAGIRPVYAQLPAERILRRIRLSDSPFCSLGWFRTPERRGVGRFSLPVYRNQPIQLLVRRRDAERFAEVRAFTDLAGTDALLGVTRGFSYGPYLDLQIAELPHRQLDRTTANQPALVRMLAKGRIDAVLVAPEERQGLLLSSGIDPERFLAIDLADVPRGNARHIWCSRSTPPEYLERIDDAIRALGLGR